MQSHRSLEGNIALVTGAGRGIGYATAQALARSGADLIIVARTKSEIANAETEARKLGADVLCIAADVTSADDVQELFRNALSQFHRLDILVNNVGVSHHSAVQDITVEDWDRVVSVNLRSAFLCTRMALPIMYQQKSGRIINVASTSAKRGYAFSSAYCAAKFGVLGFSQAVDAEAKSSGVRVSAVCPGPTDTLLRRSGHPDEDPATLLRPEDVANAILYVATQPPTANIDEITIRPRH